MADISSSVWEEDLPEDIGAACEAMLEAESALIAAESRQIRLAAHWLDLHAPEDHGPDGDRQRTLPGTERVVASGADGTPVVGEFACAELAALLGVHPMTAAARLRKVANLRHRHPSLCDRVRRGEVHGWKALETARLVGREDLGLSLEQAHWIDERSHEWITTLPWGAYLELVERLIVDADPRAAEDRRLVAATRQGVWTTQSNEHGLKTIVGKAAAGEVAYLIAVVDKVAEILADRGDTREVGPRRASALALLAHPAHVLALLAEDAALNAGPATDDPTSGATGAPADTHAADSSDDSGASGCSRGPSPAERHRPGAGNDDGTDPGDMSSQGDDASVGGESGGTGPAALTGDAVGQDEDAEAGPSDGGTGSSGEGPALPSYLAIPESLGQALTMLHRPGVLERLLPSATLYVHLDHGAVDAGVGSAQVEGLGIVTAEQARQWLGHRRVTIQPVIDLNDQVAPVDGYHFPRKIREVLHLRNPRDVFPFGVSTSRRKDIDHPVPYRHPDNGGPPGQTGLHNAGPLTRFTHRLKTHGGWRVDQLDEVTYLWHSPHGHGWLVDPTGTHVVSRGVLRRLVCPPRPARVATAS